MVAALALMAPLGTDHLVAREVVEAILAQNREGAMTMQMRALGLRELGETDLALHVLRTAYKDTTSLVAREFLERGDLDRALKALNGREIKSEPIRRVVESGSMVDLRSAISFVRECERLGALTGLEREAPYGQLPPPPRPKIIDLFETLVSYSRMDLAAWLVQHEVTHEEFVSNLSSMQRLTARGADKSMVDAYLKWGTGHFSPQSLLFAAITTEDERLLQASATAMLERQRTEILSGKSRRPYDDVVTALGMLAHKRRTKDVSAIASRFRDELVAKLADPLEGDNEALVSSYKAIGLLDVVGEAAALVERQADELAGSLDFSRDEVSRRYARAGTFYISIDDWDSARRIEDRARRAAGLETFSFDYLRKSLLAKQGKFEDALKISEYSPFDKSYGRIAHDAIEALRAKGDDDGARLLARRVLQTWIGRTNVYSLGEVGYDLYNLGLEDELDQYVSNLPQNKVFSSTNFAFFLGIGRDADAVKVLPLVKSQSPEWLLSLVRWWDKERLGPLDRLLNIEGHNVFREGLDSLLGTVNGNMRGGAASAYVFLLRFVDDDPVLTEEVVQGIGRHLSRAVNGGRYDVKKYILGSLADADPADPIDLELQRKIVRVLNESD